MLSLLFALAASAPVPRTAQSTGPVVHKTQINDTDFASFNLARRQKPFLPVNKREVREGRFANHAIKRVKRVPPPSRTPPATPRATPVIEEKPPFPTLVPVPTNPFSFPRPKTPAQESPELNQPPREQPQTHEKFEIVSVMPTTLSAKGGQPIEIQMSEEFSGAVFCRFGAHVTAGRHSDGGAKFTCLAPPLSEGSVVLSVSRDKASWSPGVTLTVVAEDSDLPWGVVAIGGVAVIGVCLLAVKMLCWKRRVPKRKSGDGIMSNVDPMEIKQRGPERKANLHHRRQDNML